MLQKYGQYYFEKNLIVASLRNYCKVNAPALVPENVLIKKWMRSSLPKAINQTRIYVCLLQNQQNAVHRQIA